MRSNLGARELHYQLRKATQISNVCCALNNLRIKHKINLNSQNADIGDFNALGFVPTEAVEDDRTAVMIRDNLMVSVINSIPE